MSTSDKKQISFHFLKKLIIFSGKGIKSSGVQFGIKDITIPKRETGYPEEVLLLTGRLPSFSPEFPKVRLCIAMFERFYSFDEIKK